MVDHQPKKIKDVAFNFSGFGAFLTIKTNPTMELMESLQKQKAENKCEHKVGDVRILNVAAEDCRDFVNEIMADLERKEKEDPETKQVLVHMGVDASAEKICLEIHGYNNADFGGPDNKNYQPFQEKIKKTFPLEHYFKTMLPIESIWDNLQKKHQVGVSDDPGRYVCNYIYYTSLCEGYKKGIPSIFIHVPEFRTISKEKQEEFLKDFMKVTREILLKEHNE